MKSTITLAFLFVFTTINLFSQLNGTYLVSPAGGNFSTLTEMANALNIQGVSGDVVINIAPGVYTEQTNMYIPGLGGASNSLTIKSQTGNPDDVIIQYFEDDSENRYVMQFQNTKNVTIKDLTFSNADLPSSAEINANISLYGDCQNFTFENNKFYGPGYGEGSAILCGYEFEYLIFTIITPHEFDNLTITNNYFQDFSTGLQCGYGLEIDGNDYNYTNDNYVITHNLYKDTGIADIRKAKGMVISHNEYSGDVDEYYNSIFLYSCTNFLVKNNKIPRISISYCDTSNNGLSIISNNFLSHSMAIHDSNNIKFAYNTLRTSSLSESLFNIISYYNNINVSVSDNIFYQSNPSGSFLNASIDYSTDPATYNNFANLSGFSNNTWFTDGSFFIDLVPGQFIYDEVPITDFNEFLLRIQNSQNNHNINPVFENDTNMHATNPMINIGVPTPSVPTDIDDETRSMITPSLGADEITLVPTNGLHLNTVLVDGQAYDGQAVLVTWDVTNLDNNTFYSPWKDRIWLSNDTTLDDADFLLDSTMTIANVTGNASYTRQAIVTLPFDEIGIRHIIVEVDSDDELFEFNIDNIKASAPFSILESPKPDLVISNITTATNPFSGTLSNIQWTVTNQGNAATMGAWTDKLFMHSNAAIFDNLTNTVINDLPWHGSKLAPVALGPGESYTNSIDFNIPIELGGIYYIHIQSDANNAIEEGNDDDNNNLTEEMFVVQSPLSDLVVTEILTPNTSFAGETIDVSVTYKNIGEATTVPTELPYLYYNYSGVSPNVNWLNRIYLNDTIVENNLNLYDPIAYGPYSDTVLLSGESYTDVYEIHLPACQAGDFFIHTISDYYNMVAESVESNNVSTSDTIHVVLNPVPDLELLNVGIYDPVLSSGSPINIHFNTINNGPANLSADDYWVDNAYLSYTDSLVIDELIFLGSYSYNFDLGAESSYAGEISGVIPQDVSGDMYLVVFNDAQKSICEIPFEENNYNFYPINIQLTPAPDLELMDAEVPYYVTAGQTYPTVFEVKNTGDGPTISGHWTDKIIIVEEGVDPYYGTLIDQHTHDGNLFVNNSYQWTSSFTIPSDFPAGNYELYYIVDAEEQEYEDEYELNNEQSFYITIDHDESNVSDLEITLFTFADAVNSGDTISLSYEVTNTSVTTNTSLWYDKIYLKNANGTILYQDYRHHLGYLNNGESYTQDILLPIPNGLDGVFQLQVVTDTTHAVIEYDLFNNTHIEQITINLSPWPNLVPTVLNVANSVSAGQNLDFNYIGTNLGAAPIDNGAWADKIYLSLDNVLDNNDLLLHSQPQAMGLNPLDIYSLDSLVHIPLTLTGDYFMIVEVDANEDIFEHTDEADNFIVSDNTISILPTLPVDFDLTFDPIDDLLVGDDNININIHVTNTSTNDAEGGWYNSFYLSDDPEWDYSDQFLGIRSVGLSEFDFNTPLLAGASYDDAINLYPDRGYETGTYYIIVKYDALNYMNELDENNNTFAAPIFIDNIPLITPGIVYEEQFISAYDRDFFKVDIPEEKGMLVKMRHIYLGNPTAEDWQWQQFYNYNPNEDDYDLFTPKYDIKVKEEHVPTPLDFDFTTTTPLQANHDVLVSVADNNRRDYIRTDCLYLPPPPNAWELPFLYADYTIEAELKEFSLYQLTPNSAGNFHNITLEIEGFDFNDSLRIELRNDADTIVAYETYVNSTEKVIAYFNPRGKSPGQYGLYMEKVNLGNSSYTPDVFELKEGGQDEVFIHVEVPSAVLVSNGYTAKVVYGNNGMVNGYDYFVVVGIYHDEFGTDSIHASFIGTDYPKNPDTEVDQWIYGNDEITNHDDFLVYTAYAPILSNNSSHELYFDIESDVQGKVWVEAIMWAIPRTEFTVSGALQDYHYSAYPYMLDSIIVEDLGIPIDEFGRFNECSKTLRVENMEQRIYKEVKKVAETANGSKSILKDFKKNLSTFFNSSDLIEKAKAGKKILDQKKELTESFDKPPFYKEINDVFNCIEDPNTNCQELQVYNAGVCSILVKCNINGRERIQTYPNCDKGGNPKYTQKKPTFFKRSWDPNEIVGPAGVTDLKLVEQQDQMNYTIYFENKAEATTPAATVTINNPLPDQFKMQSLRLTGFGFGDLSFPLDQVANVQQDFELGPAYNNQVLHMVAGLNAVDQLAFWNFTTIDPNTGQPTTDPNGGFLPPNDTTGIGQAWVSYVVDLKQNIEDGTPVNNQASITFDQNAPLETNIWTNIIGQSRLASMVDALPTYSNTSFKLSWDIEVLDSTINVPVDYYNIYYRKNDGPWKAFKTGTTLKESTFEGEEGHHYKFYSQAITLDGTIEPTHTIYDTETTIRTFVVDVNADNPFSIYPNPTNDVLYVQYFLDHDSEVTIRIVDILGRKLKQYNDIPHQAGSYNLLIEDLPALDGVFFIELLLDDTKYVQRGVFLNP